MSQENVEVVRRLHDIWLREADLAAAFDQCVREGLLDANAEWRGGPRGGRGIAGIENAVGRDEYVEMQHRVMDEFEALSLEVEQIVDAGDDRVVVITRSLGTGKRSGAPVEMRMAQVYWLEAGCVVRADPYLVPEEALKAVGLGD
jgi:ketosteroid isomerase-like protein